MSLDLSSTVKTLNGERAHVRKQLAKLDRAIAVIRKLVGNNLTTNGRSRKRTMSAAGRRKVANAQKLRWAKFKRAKTAKG